MKRVLAQTLALLLMLTMMVGLAAPALADDSGIEESNKMNIVLLVDGSASLYDNPWNPNFHASDPQGFRFEAISMFLDTLNDNSADVGVMIFTANPKNTDSDADMRSCIKENTGILPLTEPRTRSTLKKTLTDFECERDGRIQAQTDIGTALMMAQEELAAMPNADVRKSAIFLFTDGVTDLDNHALAIAASERNRETAIQNIKDSGILLCGVLLNDGGLLSSDEMRDIVMRANNQNSPNQLGDLFVEITDARDCTEATDRFMNLLEDYIIDPVGERVITNHFSETILIPGLGVEEAMFRVRTPDGSKLPDIYTGADPIPNGQLRITFDKPDGSTLRYSDFLSPLDRDKWEALSGDTYVVLKLKKPASGDWTIHVDVGGDEEIEILYKAILNLNIGAEIEMNPAVDQMKAGDDVKLTAVLVQNGEKKYDTGFYEGYDVKLILTDKDSSGIETTKDEPLQRDPNDGNRYNYTVHMDYHAYTAQVEFSCGDIRFRSDPISWMIGNEAPTIQSSYTVKMKSGLFQSKEHLEDIDLGSDKEDGTNLTYEIVSGGSFDPDHVKLRDNKTLVFQTKDSEDGTVLIRVSDTMGLSADMTVYVEVTNMTLRLVLLMVAGLIALAIATLLIIRFVINGPVPSGYCTVDFQVPSDNRYISVNLTPAAPGTISEVKRKTTLYDIINADLSRPTVQGVAPKDVGEVKSFINGEAMKELRAIPVKCVTGHVDKGNYSGKKVAVVQLAVRLSGSLTRLYNNAVTLTIAGVPMDFGYYDYDAQDEGDDPYGDSYGTPYGAPTDSYGEQTEPYGVSDPFGGAADGGSGDPNGPDNYSF